MRRLWLLVLIGFSTACASGPVTRPTTIASLADADRIRLDGCYECLLEARDLYRVASSGPNRVRAGLREFETELLLALREREFAVDNVATLDRARILAAALPASLDAQRYVDLVAAVPHSGAGWSRRDRTAFVAAHADVLDDVTSEAVWVRGGALAPVVRDYLARSLECAAVPSATRQRQPGPPAAPPSADVPPLMRYREATCRQVHATTLVELRSLVPRFVETSYFIGELAVTSIADAGAPNPHRLVEDVRARFPASPMVAFLAARLRQVVGDCEGAVSAFDQLLALTPDHEDGSLGRVMCLTDLLRQDDAVRAATRMIDDAYDNADEARYWRAWNQHLRGELVAARADIDEVRQRRSNAGILTLAGVIEHDQADFDRAERDLRDAQRMGSNRVCRAYYYLGSVLLKRQALAEALQAFQSALTCYDDDATSRDRVIETTLANPAVDAEFRRVQTVRLREEARLLRHQHYSSALNVANIQVARRDVAAAGPFLEIAARDPQLVTEVAALRAEIGRVVEAGAQSRP